MSDKSTPTGNEARLAPIHPGEIIASEFLQPLTISPSELAQHLRMPPEELALLTRGARDVTADDALPLARYFDTTPEFWLNLQTQHDLEVTRERISHELTAITPYAGDNDT